MSTDIQGKLRIGPHKGYSGTAEYDAEAGIFHGEVDDLRDVITFQGKAIEKLRTAFSESVDDYLSFCAVRGENPEKPFSGKFITRVPPTLHKKINQAAKVRGWSLNRFVQSVLQDAVQGDSGKLRRSAKKSNPTKSGGRRKVVRKLTTG